MQERRLPQTTSAILKCVLFAMPTWCFSILLWSGMGNALLRADRWWLVPFILLLCLGICVPSSLTAEFVWRKRDVYSSIASQTAVLLLVATSIGILSYIAYAAQSGFMGGWELILWIFVSMIQLLIFAALVYVTDRESWKKSDTPKGKKS